MQYIPGPAETLAPALQVFMEGLNHAIDPNYKLREAVKANMAMNPELLQNLANAEAKSPGTLAALGLGKIGETVAQTPADVKTQDEITNRQSILDNAQANRTSNTEQAKLKGNLAAAGNAAIADPNSIASKEAGNIAATGMPSWEMATGQQKQEYMKMTQQVIKDGVPITVQKLEKGEYTPEQMIGIFNSPLGEGLKLMVDADNEKYRRALMNRQITADSAMQRLMLNQAFQLYQDTRAGSPQAFMALMADPKRARDLADHPEKAVTAEDKAILAAQQGIDHLNVADRVKQNSEVRKNIEAAQISLRAVKPNDPNADVQRASAVNDLNQAFANRAALLGTPAFKAEYKTIVKSFWPDSKEIVYTDETGNEVPESVAMNGYPTDTQFEQTVGRTFNELRKVQNDPVAFEKALGEVKSKNPTVYSAVLARLNSMKK